MKERVLLSVLGTQTLHGDVPEAIELTTEGILEETEEILSLRYDETEMTGMEGVTTDFRVFSDRIELLRTGNLESQMIFEEGVRHQCLYQMGFGALLLGISTRTARCKKTEQGVELYVDYALDVEDEPVGVNVYHVKARRIGD